MWTFFFVLLLASALVSAVTYFLWRKITHVELLWQIGVQVIVVAVSVAIVSYSSKADTEVWSGRVTGKEQKYVSCQHSYQCNCITTSCGKDCTTTICQTCYSHDNDWDWNVYTSLGEVIEIQRIDSRGEYTPPRWEQAYVGEPTATPHVYANYIKAAPDTLFRRQGLIEKYAKTLPEYPEQNYDYYRATRFLSDLRGSWQTYTTWNSAVAELNADVGHSKQANIIVLLTSKKSRDWAEALEEKWLGGKKNDIVVIINDNDNAGPPEWVTVLAWTTAEIFKVRLRDELLVANNVQDVNVVMPIIKNNIVKYFKRKPMADFEYLAGTINPSMTAWLLTFIVSVFASLGITFFIHRRNELH